MQVKTIEEKSVHFASPENIDPNGRIFFWQQGVYRAINNDKESFYRELLDDCKVSELFDAGLVVTKPADITLSGHAFTVQHDRVPVVSYVTEWSAAMLKEAALVTLRLSLELEKRAMQLQDAHPWNVLFVGTSAKFIDFTSIVEIQNPDHWTPLEEFIGTFLHPLKLMSEGSEMVARRALVDWRKLRGARISKFRAIFELAKQGRFSSAFKFIGENYRPVASGLRGQLEELIKKVEGIPVRFDDTAWSDYCDDEVDLATYSDWMIKRRTVADVLDRCSPDSLLDIGCNTGWFSKLASLKGSRTVAFDLDEPSINRLFQSKIAGELGILPLVVDFIDPPPAYGIALRCASPYERFSSEFVLGLAIVHHLVFKQGETFRTIVEKISMYTSKWLLIEFIPREDKYVWKYFERWPSYHRKFDWYNAENFQKELGKHFSKVEVLPSNPNPRVMMLCER